MLRAEDVLHQKLQCGVGGKNTNIRDIGIIARYGLYAVSISRASNKHVLALNYCFPHPQKQYDHSNIIILWT